MNEDSPYTIRESKSYGAEANQVYLAAQKAVAGLQGKILDEDAEAGSLMAQFDKKIHDTFLGDRSQIIVVVDSQGPESTKVSTEVYPVNPIGQKLMFGGRKGVSESVNSWYWAHLEHNLNASE